VIILIVTDIEHSKWDIDQDIITAVIVGSNDVDFSSSLNLAKKLCCGRMILESGIALEDLPQNGVRKGDFFFRMKSDVDHGLKVGKELMLDDKK